MPAQYHYTKLQDATQEKEGSVEELAARCRRMCQKTIRNVQDEATQRIINEEAERQLVAAYINGLAGIVGQQVRFRMPHTLEEAVQVAVTVSNAEWMRTSDTKRVFIAKRDSSSQGICFNCGKRFITRMTAGHQGRTGLLQGMVTLAMRLEAEGKLRPAKCRGTPPLQGTLAENKFGASIVRNWVTVKISVPNLWEIIQHPQTAMGRWQDP
jgi:hypothetical protein